MPKAPLTSGPLDPLQDLGRPILLIDNRGVSQGPYQVTGIERVPALGRRGFIPLLVPSTGPLAGYEVYGGEATNGIPAGGSVSVNPIALQLNPQTLFQFRMLLRVVGTLPTGVAVDDFDLAVNYPQAVAHWQLQQVGGVLNATYQFAMPADATLGAAQGADQALPAAYPALVDPMTAAYQTEVFIWGATNIQFRLANNSATAIANTAALMVGLNVSGIRYDVDNWPTALASQATRTFQVGSGKAVEAPPDTVLVPATAFAPTTKSGVT